MRAWIQVDPSCSKAPRQRVNSYWSFSGAEKKIPRLAHRSWTNNFLSIWWKSIFIWHFRSLAHFFPASWNFSPCSPICTEVGLKLWGEKQGGVCVDLFPHMLHIIAPRLMACSNLCRGTVPSVGLSVPVVTLSCAHAFYLPWLVCPSCWRSPLSILLEAP